MPSNFTQNYQLSQWEATDQVCRTDFNSDNAKIDAAIKAVSDSIPQFIFGSYTGNGAATQDIHLGCQPKALLVFREDGAVTHYPITHNTLGGLAFPDQPIIYSGHTALEITENGFRVYYNSSYSIYCNMKANFYYIAFV